MEDDGLCLSLGLKTFEKRPALTTPPPPPPPPLKHSSSICRYRFSPERVNCKNSIFHKSPPEVCGSKTQHLAPYTAMLNLGWVNAKSISKPRDKNKRLDQDKLKVLAPYNELSSATNKRTGAEREVIINDGKDDGNHRRNGGDRREKKKTSLSKEQSSLLEQTFLQNSTLNNKQKLHLAKQLNLVPRKVEVWFQNKRARTKLKQTEVDCESLKKYCRRLSEENRRLHKELQLLKSPQNLCHVCKRGSATSSFVPIIRPADQLTVSDLFPNSSSLLKI